MKDGNTDLKTIPCVADDKNIGFFHDLGEVRALLRKKMEHTVESLE